MIPTCQLAPLASHGVERVENRLPASVWEAPRASKSGSVQSRFLWQGRRGREASELWPGTHDGSSVAEKTVPPPSQRLELLRALLQEANREGLLATSNGYDAAGNAQGGNSGLPAEKVPAWAEELDDIVCAWPMIGESVQHGLMVIVRAQSSRSVRP